jgi:hypothetical protein
MSTVKKEEEADLHVMYQLRKALHSPSGFPVEFRSGKAHVHPAHAHQALIAYEFLKPKEKGAFQKRLEQSYAELKRTLKESVEETIATFLAEEKEAIAAS